MAIKKAFLNFPQIFLPRASLASILLLLRIGGIEHQMATMDLIKLAVCRDYQFPMVNPDKDSG